MIKTSVLGALCLVALPLVAQAGESDTGFMPANGIFVGAGGAWNGANFPDQNIYGFGVSQNYAIGRILVATGAAAGNAYPNLGTDSSLSPVIQAGFYRTFEGTPWIWGAKFSYNQVGVTGVARDVLIPQTGGYTGLIQGTFTGNYLLSSYEVSLDHQFALVPILGYSFGRGFVYGGAGATLSRLTNNMNGLVGFAELDHRYAVSGAPAFFSDSNWVWGATATAGVTYFFARGWFLDLSYSYTASATPTNAFANQFDTSYPQVEFVGVSGGYRSGTANNQALTVTVNYAF